MIKLLFKILLYILLFVFASIYFTPKENLYFYLEEELQKHKVVLSNENLNEKAFGLDIKDINLYYNKTSVAKIDHIDSSFLLFSNTITIDKINVDSSFKAFIPTQIKNINIRYTILDPMNVNIKADTKLGLVTGTYSIVDKKITLLLQDSSKVSRKYKQILSRYKTKEGSYKYEFKF